MFQVAPSPNLLALSDDRQYNHLKFPVDDAAAHSGAVAPAFIVNTCAVIADVDVGDTVYVRIWVSGGSTVIDLKGNGTTETSATFFSGALLA